MKIIGFGHRKRMGKNTCSNLLKGWLEQCHPEAKVKQMSFAYKIKDICHQLYSWAGMKTPDYYDKNPEEKEQYLEPLGKTAREVMIDLGTKGIRDNVYKNTWLDYVFNQGEYDYLLISDVRFPNEFKEVKKRNGICVEVIRPQEKITHDVADDALGEKVEWDVRIINDGTLEDLSETMKVLMKEVIDAEQDKN